MLLHHSRRCSTGSPICLRMTRGALFIQKSPLTLFGCAHHCYADISLAHLFFFFHFSSSSSLTYASNTTPQKWTSLAIPFKPSSSPSSELSPVPTLFPSISNCQAYRGSSSRQNPQEGRVKMANRLCSKDMKKQRPLLSGTTSYNWA